MENKSELIDAVLQLGDNALILGHRLGEWCGHGPVLEQDIAMTNIALDLIGQARLYLSYAAELRDDGSDEDTMAYRRDSLDFKNVLLCEIPNGDFADTVARQFYFDQWNYLFLAGLKTSSNETLSEIAEKALKEVTYHQRWSSEWVVRLGDGTEESREKMQRAINDAWMYTGEMFNPSPADQAMSKGGVFPDVEVLKDPWMKRVKDTLDEATLAMPTDEWMQSGGKTGYHTEHLGYILAEMQFLQRAYPEATW